MFFMVSQEMVCIVFLIAAQNVLCADNLIFIGHSHGGMVLKEFIQLMLNNNLTIQNWKFVILGCPIHVKSNFKSIESNKIPTILQYHNKSEDREEIIEIDERRDWKTENNPSFIKPLSQSIFFYNARHIRIRINK
jgi:hypothetical protein